MATVIAPSIHYPGFRCLGRAVIRPLLVLTALAAGLAPAAETWTALGRLGLAPVSLYGVKAIAAGGGYGPASFEKVVAVRRDGTVVAWGGNASVPNGLNNVVAVAAGLYHTLALKSDGTVVAWGYGSSGETVVPVGLTGVTAIAANGSQSLALKADGTVVAWGSNSTNLPAGLSGIVAIAAGGAHAVAVKADGTVVAWGYNADGQTAVPAGLSGVVAVTAGNYHTVALKRDGTVVAWGGNGQVPAGLSDVVAISSCASTTLALKGNGTVVAWGADMAGEIAQASSLSNIVAVAAGGFHSVALGMDGRVTVIGGMRGPSVDLNVVSQIASGPEEDFFAARTVAGSVITWGDANSSMTTVPASLMTAASVAVTYRSVQVLKTDGTVVAWGTGAEATVPAGLSGVTSLAAGKNHVLALKSDGTVVGWGSNGSGESTTSGLTGIRAIAAGNAFSLALRNDGTVTAFGDNTFGKVTVPAGLSGVVAVVAGASHALALKGDGTVVGWGDNSSNQATPPSGLSAVSAIAAGFTHSLALRQDGTVVAWGRTIEGVISAPATVTGVTAIAAGGNSSWLRLPARPTNAVAISIPTNLVADGTPKFVTATSANGRRPTRVTYNGSDALPLAVGTYTVVAEADYMDSYGTATGSLVIRSAQTVSFPTIPATTYGVAPVTLAATANSGLAISYAVISGPGTVTGSTLTITGAGTIRIQASQAGDATYAPASASQDVVVAPAILTVTADDQFRTYGAANPVLTYTGTGWQGADTSAVLTGTLATSAIATSPVGSYPITVGTLRATSGNYTISLVSGAQVTVTPATLLVTATNQGRLVGAANPTLTATISGYVNGEDASVVTGGPVLSTTATAGSAAGVYPITVDVSGMSATNYGFVGVGGSLVVSNAPPATDGGGGGGGGGCGIGSSLGLLLAPLLAALRFWRRRERVG